MACGAKLLLPLALWLLMIDGVEGDLRCEKSGNGKIGGAGEGE